MKKFVFALLGMLMLPLGSCTEDSPEKASPDYFITRDLSFLLEEEDPLAAKGWPVTGCKEFDVKTKLPFVGEVRFTILHCCVNLVCNAKSLSNVVDYFMGGKEVPDIKSVEVISSSVIRFGKYDIEINPGVYRLNPKSHSVQDLEYRVTIRDRVATPNP